MKTILNHTRIAQLSLSTIAVLMALTHTQAATTDADPSAEGIRWDTLSVKVSTDNRVYEPGKPVVMMLDARNEGDAPMRLDFASGQRFDFSVLDASGNAIWTWSANKNFVQVLGTVILQPGESLRYQTDEFIAPEQGIFSVEGRITSTEPFKGQSVFGVEVEPLSINGVWSGESQGYPAFMNPWELWTGIVWYDRFYGEWADQYGNQGMFKAHRIASSDPGLIRFEGEWIGYGYGNAKGPFSVEFILSEGTCSGSLTSVRNPAFNRSIRGTKTDRGTDSLGNPNPSPAP
ncbi:MAG: hypothetical protein JW706_08340 [Opitutales bacterium]|nr:hypothetical protein [Opitutales bacterium]